MPAKLQLKPAMKLTIFVGADERREHHPLYQEVLRILHDEGIGGATLTRGVMSFGSQRSIHSSKNEITMENLPIIIEAVNDVSKIDRAAALVAEMLGEHGLVDLRPTMAVHRPIAESERSGAQNA